MTAPTDIVPAVPIVPDAVTNAVSNAAPDTTAADKGVVTPGRREAAEWEVQQAWLHLANVQLSSRLAAVLLARFAGDPRALIFASDEELEQAGCPPPPLSRLRGAEFAPTPEQLKWLERDDIHLLWQAHPDYPRVLRDIPGSPPLLFVRGQLRDTDAFGVGMVGSRRATPYGRSIAHKLARELTAHGLAVISGGAIGIDTAAHQGALDGGGRTIAIVGCGLDIDYPQPNRALFDRIAAQGAILTEYPFGSQPESWRFPQRNRLISGLALGVVVVEAPESSGALNTVRHALEQGRTVMTVPGNIDRPASAGTNNLLKEGAVPITQTEDILRALNMVIVPAVPEHQRAFDLPWEDAAPADGKAASVAASKQPRAAADLNAAGLHTTSAEAAQSAAQNSARAQAGTGVSEAQRRLLACLSLTPRHIDAIAQEAGMTATQTGVEMTLMEMSGLVRRLPGNAYIRAL